MQHFAKDCKVNANIFQVNAEVLEANAKVSWGMLNFNK